MKQCVSIAVALIMLVIAVCAQTQKQIATVTAGSATITDFKGDVHIQPAGAPVAPPRKGYLLGPESVIETAKGSVVLTLQDGSQVLVRANSRVTLKDPATGGSFLEQWLGKILVKAKKRLNGEPSFTMGTPSAVISVRGTQFEVSVTKAHKTSVSVYEGQVEVRGANGGSVLLGPGFGTSVIENEAPQRPYEVPSAGGAHSSGGTSTRYQREEDWPSNRQPTDGTNQFPIPEDTPDE